MTTFLMFGKYSQEGMQGISASRTDQAKDLISKHGGQLRAMYATLGPYDLVFVVEMPGVEEAMQASIGLNKLCGIGFTTAPAVDVRTFDQLVAGA